MAVCTAYVHFWPKATSRFADQSLPFCGCLLAPCLSAMHFRTNSARFRFAMFCCFACVMHSCRSCRRNTGPLKAGEAGAAVWAMMSAVNRTSARTTSRYRIVDACKEDRSSILVNHCAHAECSEYAGRGRVTQNFDPSHGRLSGVGTFCFGHAGDVVVQLCWSIPHQFQERQGLFYLAWLLLSLASTSAPDCDTALLEMRRGLSAFGPKQTSTCTAHVRFRGWSRRHLLRKFAFAVAIG